MRDVALAKDWTHGFFAGFLKRQSVHQADRENGRFRSYLLVAVNQFSAGSAHGACKTETGAHEMKWLWVEESCVGCQSSVVLNLIATRLRVGDDTPYPGGIIGRSDRPGPPASDSYADVGCGKLSGLPKFCCLEIDCHKVARQGRHALPLRFQRDGLFHPGTEVVEFVKAF